MIMIGCEVDRKSLSFEIGARGHCNGNKNGGSREGYMYSTLSLEHQIQAKVVSSFPGVEGFCDTARVASRALLAIPILVLPLFASVY